MGGACVGLGKWEEQAFSLLGGSEQCPGAHGPPKQGGTTEGGGLMDVPKVVHPPPIHCPRGDRKPKQKCLPGEF